MNSLQKYLKPFIASLIMLFCLNAAAIADNNKLVGNWKSAKINIHLKANHTYTYKMKALNFSGKWSATGSKLTMNYSLLGFKKKRTSIYSFKGKDLVLSNNKGNITLKKQ